MKAQLLALTPLFLTLSAQAAAPAPGEYIIVDPTSLEVSVGVADPTNFRASPVLSSRNLNWAEFPEGVAVGLPGTRLMLEDPHSTLMVNGPAVEGSAVWTVTFNNGYTQRSDSAGLRVSQVMGSAVTLPMQAIPVPGFRPSCRLDGNVTQEVLLNAEGHPTFIRSARVTVRAFREDCTQQMADLLNGVRGLPGLSSIVLNPNNGGDQSIEVQALRQLLDTMEPGLGAHPETVRSLWIRAESPLLTADEYADSLAAAEAAAAAPVAEDAALVPLDHVPVHRAEIR